MEKHDFDVVDKIGGMVHAYACGYNEHERNKTKTRKIGEIFGTPINVNVDSIQKVIVNKKTN